MDREEVITNVNRFFRRIKLTGKNYIYPVNRSVGFKGLSETIGEDLALKLCQKAIDSPEDVYQVKLRRGLKIKFESA